MPSKSEMMHHRLQAWIRENKSHKDLEYLGYKPDKLGVEHHYYRIADHEVSVDMIEDLEQVEDETS
tara:strand:+ start:448 stop:645 length:198 start_codon:yes stop_codon:yes gene_type:complete